ncbi:hypothetical protein PSACC_03413 [Paramicrosporidium saccamoebae]|uniref:1-alkyl-2-acetylglycerophosphocholine esterase n=1 Tax=Paramicrosporidium saccamoebae TaxID=1246581 RepID=A0A2H9TG77_9FUNG|nr:hypothetical protein PSACC_03413 [Paramicrosporidium saccamoebae]
MSQLQDETVLQYRHPPSNDDEAHEFRATQLLHRTQEVSATIDLMLSDALSPSVWKQTSTHEPTDRGDLVTDPLSQFRGRIKKDFVAMAGHSFGAATGFLAAQKDHRIGSMLAFDPWMFPLPSNYNEKVQLRALPTLVINSSTFHWPSNLQSLAMLLQRNHELGSLQSMQITLNSTGHLDQSDFSAIIPAWIRNRYRSGATADPVDVLTTNAQLNFAFLDRIFQRTPNSLNPYRDILWKDAKPSSKFTVDIKL